MNIAIIGCGNIAKRIAQGILYSDGFLYAVASRDKERARSFADAFSVPNAYTYDECLNDINIDLVYIATVNSTHKALIRRCLEKHKNVICEKPMLSTTKEIEEMFALAKRNKCFLMEAHKTCFTELNKLILKDYINEIGKIMHIEARYTSKSDLSLQKQKDINDGMGGCFYDLGVYPSCFSNLYAKSNIVDISVHTKTLTGYKCDLDTTVNITYENGITAYLRSSSIIEEPNLGIIYGENGRIEIEKFWKNTEAVVFIDNEIKNIVVNQKSDFTGEINEAINCIKKGMLQSSIMSEKDSLKICTICEKVKEKINNSEYLKL